MAGRGGGACAWPAGGRAAAGAPVKHKPGRRRWQRRGAGAEMALTAGRRRRQDLDNVSAGLRGGRFPRGGWGERLAFPFVSAFPSSPLFVCTTRWRLYLLLLPGGAAGPGVCKWPFRK